MKHFTLMFGLLLLFGALLVTSADYSFPEEEEYTEPEYYNRPENARKCTEVIDYASVYCKPIVQDGYQHHYLESGPDEAKCAEKIIHYRCVAEAICLECSVEVARLYDRLQREQLQRDLDELSPICDHHLMVTLDESYCDYLEGAWDHLLMPADDEQEYFEDEEETELPAVENTCPAFKLY